MRAPLVEGGRHVVLVGLMGSGKTTVGRRVAKRLGWSFADADEELVQRTGRTIRQWFANEGEDSFREAETWILAELLARPAPTVIAAGGGVVVAAANRKRLQAPDVLVVWLRGSPELLARRVEQKELRRSHRPLLDGDVAASLAKLSAEREPWYAAVADVVVDIDPVHRDDEHPKKRLAALVEDAVRAELGRSLEA